MEKAELLYTRLKENIPFAFLKLNDGEIKGLKHDATGISRGAERSSARMAQKLLEALNFRKDNYYIGLPCSRCHSSLYTEAVNHISPQDDLAMSNVLSANTLINSNLEKTIEVLKECMGEKRIVIVTNSKNMANIAQLEQLNIKPYRVIEVAEKYAFETDYERIKDEWKTLQNGDIVICLCGPLGRVLCYEWFNANPTLTCLELGSMFDPLLQSRSYIYHTGNHHYCEECYPSQEANVSSLITLCAGRALNKECFYFYSWEDNESFYQCNYEKIKRNTEIRLEKEPGNTDLEEIIHKCEQKINGGDENVTIQNLRETDYRNNNKTQLFQLAEQFYNQRKLSDLDTVCDLYVDYFGKMDSPQLHKILFYSSFANFDANQKKAIQQGEQLYDKEEVAEDLRFFTRCNLERLYSKDHTPIPKVIHLIYFKESDFQNYHYGCVMSVVKHMPTYTIHLYNDIEPINNKYWDLIKQEANIKIIPYERPYQYDGFDLQYVQYAADVARLELLYKYGGIYLDLDMLIIKNFDTIINTGKDLYISEEGEKGGGWINSFIACKPKNEFINIWLKSFRTGLRMESWAWHIREGNRQLVKEHPHYMLKYNIEILESKYFFPFPWTDREKFIHIEENLNEEIYGVHLFETILHDILWNNKYFTNSFQNVWIKRRKICVFMSDNRPLHNNIEDAEYPSLAAAINYHYCKKHNYDFIYYRPYLGTENEISLYNCINPNTKETRYAAWSKLLSTLEALKLNYEYVVYIDSDCIFKNTDIAIETFIEPNEDKNIIFLNNKPWHLNKPCSGFYICKANSHTKEIIQKWYNYDSGIYDKTHPWEQDSLMKFYDKINISIIDSMMFYEENNQFLRHIGTWESDNRKPYFLNIINTRNINYTENINNIHTINYNTLSSVKESSAILGKNLIH
jgi:mannosyltransferase OCH1-like enzyme